MKFSLTTVLWLLAVVSAFLTGITAQSIIDPQTPVLVASENVDSYEPVNASNLTLEHRRRSNVPIGALTDLSQVKDKRATRKVRYGQVLFPEDVTGHIRHVSFYEGYGAVSLRVKLSKHSLALHLFSHWDRISIHYQEEGDDGALQPKLIANEARIWSVNENPTNDSAIVGLIVTDEQKKLIFAVQENEDGGDFVFDRPLIGE